MKRAEQPRTFTAFCTGCSLFLFLVVLVGIAPPRAFATAVSDGSLQLQSFTITPNRGSILFAPVGSTFASVENSLGEFNASFDSGVRPHSNASVTWTNAQASLDSTKQTGFVRADSFIPPDVLGSSSAFAQGIFRDFSFSVTGATGPVAVQFNAILPFAESLMTDEFGTASSGVTFLLSLDGAPILDSQVSYSVAADSNMSRRGTLNLENSVTLMADQSYTMRLTLLAVSDTSSTPTPEPATFWLLFAGGVPTFFVRELRFFRS